MGWIAPVAMGVAGIASSLLGKGKDSKPAETRFTTLSNLDPGQQALQTKLEQILQSNLGEGVSSYPGTYTPGPSGTQTQLFDLVSKLLQGYGPMQQEGMGVLTDLMQPYSDTKAKSYWDTAVRKPMMESWQKDILPEVMNQFANYDAAGSGPAMKAVAESGRRLDTDMGGILSKVLMDYENQYKNRGLDASKAGLAYPETLISSVLPAANMQRQITAEQMWEPYQDWLYEQDYNNPWLKLLPQAMKPTFTNQAYQAGGVQGQQGVGPDIMKAIMGMGGSIFGSKAGSEWLFS